MEASVAGGALLGDISPLDLELDIGGRTVDVVFQSLRDARIPVAASETGGVFGTRLTVDLDTMTSIATPFMGLSPASVTRPPRLTPDAIDRAIEHVRPIPQTALKIIRMLHEDDYGLREVALELGRDQVLSGRILRVCNAAARAGRRDITSIEQALVLLGGRLVGAMIVSSSVHGLFDESVRGYSMSRGGLYHHAVSTGIIARQLAELTEALQPDLAYVGGLLHDIGKVVLDQAVASARPFFYRELNSTGRNLVDLERSVLGLSHEEAGARLAILWGLPDVLADVIAHHGAPDTSANGSIPTCLVHVADLLASGFDPGQELDRHGTWAFAGALERLGLSSWSIERVVGSIRWAELAEPGYF